jgi:UDP-N-acetylglucosamine 2-epimerase (non-hydrolysing)
LVVTCVVGARPNFMKIAPIVLELRRRGIPHRLLHTGQHYDANMAATFFEELGMPRPDVDLGVGSDTQARQTAKVMVAFEEVCGRERPDLILVGGDVNSTTAVALVAAKERIPLGHVEAGLRSFDRNMPEEVNRIVTDHLSDLLFTTEESANRNLAAEGLPATRTHFVGNCMVDTLRKHEAIAISLAPWRTMGYSPDGYSLLTLHRPSNVDAATDLRRIMAVIDRVAARIPVIFPVHPRTRQRIEASGLKPGRGISLCDPLPYVTFLGLMARAKFVMTDSGGIQEETTALSVPCLTLRDNTERPVTLTHGTNRLVGSSAARLEECAGLLLDGERPSGTSVPLWDGHAAQRVVDVIMKRATE